MCVVRDSEVIFERKERGKEMRGKDWWKVFEGMVDGVSESGVWKV